ncbi:hypothetical protein [Fluviispira multicolorata]|uniref:Uncharacterized protein n=1 Tax=Fluviispira multicolorata TaxID=2654512 RepID=A0A833N6E0_9BACT|nr:hypothetical protein [Fluviispira multicolorata]KAB8033310.1 hypothetical protein GCL57_01025 [Fluviispira multicolorata]
MNIKKIFPETYKHLKLIEKNSKVTEFLNTSLEIISTNYAIYPLQKDYLIIEISNSYQHFGFSLFANTSIHFIASELHSVTGVENGVILNWLNITADLILQDLAFPTKENINDKEKLEQIFSIEFIKRIFCSEKEEDYLTGMSVFSGDIIENIRKISREKIARITTKKEYEWNDTVLESHEFFLDNYPHIKNTLFNFLFQLHTDPLSLLSWRLESFISFIDKKEGSIFILRENNLNKKTDPKRIMAIVSLLVPHSDETGNLLLPHSPISVSQIARLFSPGFKSDKFQIDILKNWININDNDGLKREIEILLETGVEYGLFFKVPNGQKGFSYGLSDNGLKIIKPFHSVLTDTILKNSIDHL